jgi:hypothetical protein
MAQDELDRRAEVPEGGDGANPEPRHLSREPWWVIPLSGAVTALLPLLKYGRFQRAVPGVGLVEAMSLAGTLGLLASTVLVARSHVRTPVWSNVVLWLGILVVGIGVSVLLALMPA